MLAPLKLLQEDEEDESGACGEEVELPLCSSTELSECRYPGSDPHEKHFWDCLAHFKRDASAFKDPSKPYINRWVICVLKDSDLI